MEQYSKVEYPQWATHYFAYNYSGEFKVTGEKLYKIFHTEYEWYIVDDIGENLFDPPLLRIDGELRNYKIK